MENWQDYYQTLGVDPDASNEEIKEAFRYKSQTIYPDKVPEKFKQRATEEFKRVKEAYETLKDPEKRRQYHAEWLQRAGKASTSQAPKPRPVVTPPSIRFFDVAAGDVQRGSFVVQNEGGPYDRIWVSNPDSWVRISGYQSVDPSDELPLQIEIEAVGEEWGKHYVEHITVRLDDQETQVTVELQTKAKSKTTTPPFGVTTGPSGRARVKVPTSSQVMSVLLGIAAGLVIGGAIVYALIFHTGRFGPTLGRILVGIGVTALLGSGITFLFRNEDLFWIVAGLGIAIAAGVFAAKGVSDFNANLVAQGVFTLCSGVGGGVVGYRVLESGAFSRAAVRKVAIKQVWGRSVWTRRVLISLLGVTFLVLILHFAVPSVPSLPQEVYSQNSQEAGYHLAWSPDRRRIAFVSTNFTSHGGMSLVGIDGSDPRRVSLNFSGGYDIGSVAWSPDGQRIAFTKRSFKDAAQSDFFEWTDSFGEIYILNLAEGDTYRLARGYDPTWSPDGHKLAFVGNPPEGSDLCIISDDGSPLFRYEVSPIEKPSLADPSWSPDGQMIVVVVGDYEENKVPLGLRGSGDIWTVDVREPFAERFIQKIAEGNYNSPVWSPDGKQIAFVNAANREIYVANRNGTRIRRLTHNNAYKFNLAWSEDGQAILFYVSGQGLYKVRAVDGKTSLICRSR